MAWYEVPEGEAVCGNCEHYHRHYVSDLKGGYVPILSGHCSHPRNKPRQANDACERFERRKAWRR